MSSKPAKASKPAAGIPGISDRQTLRERARHNVEDGAITDSYSADRKVVIVAQRCPGHRVRVRAALLPALFHGQGMLADAVKAEFLEHAQRSRRTPASWPSASCSLAASRTSTRTR